ncbi:hypothetical protein DSL72_004223 [Monilinia vaccinii-corymbosi]|uniref:Uncharacterized protein n=1 Tax=Monilinia vaccinii-corymbosi TaxID=61207 RepID=A0A8A3P3B2_9HELO|nr:hypothetical protein DSL72_004223 [Monilinia vaccinii-corymbosi]
MLRRAPTAITLTAEDVALYEDSRQAEREGEEEEEQKAKAEAVRYRKARERSAFGVGRGDGYMELQAVAAQRRVDDARERERSAGGREVRGGRAQSRESNAENEMSEDEGRVIERQREERVAGRVTERVRSRLLLRDRDAREQRSREERLGLGGGSASGR